LLIAAISAARPSNTYWVIRDIPNDSKWKRRKDDGYFASTARARVLCRVVRKEVSNKALRRLSAMCAVDASVKT
jgi:hypothetical protein